MIKAKRNIIIVTILSLLLFVIGFSFMENPVKKAYAEATETSEVSTVSDDGAAFELVQGLSLMKIYSTKEEFLGTQVSDPYYGVDFWIPNSYYAALTAPTIFDSIFGSPYWYPNEYYLKLTRSNSEKEIIQEWYYHNDPNYSLLATMGYDNLYELDIEVDKDTGHYKMKFKMPFSVTEDLSIDYTYSVSYERLEANYNTLGPLTTKARIANSTSADASGSFTRNIKAVAQAVIKYEGSSLDEYNYAYFNELANNNVSAETMMSVHFFYYGSGVMPILKTYEMSALYAFDREAVIKHVMVQENAYIINDNGKGVYKESVFDVYPSDSDAGDRALLVAEGRERWEYDTSLYDASSADTREVYLTVTYDDFRWQDFRIKIFDNDNNGVSEEANEFIGSMPYYLTNVDHLGGGSFRVSYHRLKAFVAQTCVVLGDINADNIFVEAGRSFLGSYEVCDPTAETDGYISFNYSNDPSELLDLYIGVSLQVVPDHERDVTLDVTAVTNFNSDGSLSYSGGGFDAGTYMYSDILNMTSSVRAFKSSALYQEILNGEVDGGYGEDFFKELIDVEVQMSGSWTDDNPTVTIRTIYRYNPVFEITDSEGDVWYRPLHNYTLRHEYSHFDISSEMPLDYSVYDIRLSSNEGDYVSKFEFDRANIPDMYLMMDIAYSDAYHYDTSTAMGYNLVIPLYVEYVDGYTFHVEYFEQYVCDRREVTPFATKKTKTLVAAADQVDLQNLTLSTLAKLWGDNVTVEDFTITNLIRPNEALAIEWLETSGVANIKLEYGYTTVRYKDYNGQVRDEKVELSTFTDFKTLIGDPTFNYTNLNTEDGKWYMYSNESVAEDELWGLFTIAYFKEYVSDFNRIFASTAYTGLMVTVKAKEVKGSDFYKAVKAVYDKNDILKIPSFLLLAFGELVDADNHTLYTYYNYLDGSEPYGSLSLTGNTDPTDDDNAFEEEVENIKDNILETSDGISKLLDGLGAALAGFSGLLAGVQNFGMVLGIVVIAVVVGVVILIIQKTRNNDKKRRK